jgi:hypothetical protein
VWRLLRLATDPRPLLIVRVLDFLEAAFGGMAHHERPRESEHALELGRRFVSGFVCLLCFTGFGVAALLADEPIPAMVSVVFAMIPLVALVLLRRDAYSVLRKYRHHFARCERCGYDLRATPGQCPECGSVKKSGEEAGGEEKRGTSLMGH